ncbi:hypothetical protein JCM10213_005397 [Rhodosporidiobolus nylandii]
MSTIDIVSQRRGSAASEVSVNISISTTSSAAPPGEPALIEPSQLATVEPFAGRSLPPTPSEPPCLPVLPTINVEAANDYQFPPPPYSSPPPAPAATVTPLSFFPFSTLTPVTSSFPPIDPPAPAERPLGFGGDQKDSVEQDLEAQVETLETRGAGVWSGYPAARSESEVEESLRLWREEEVLWAKRCLWSLGALFALAAVTGVIVSSLLGKI